MVDLKRKELEYTLRTNLSRLVSNRSHSFSPCREMLEKIREIDAKALLCGSAVRDLLLKGTRFIPRDLDIILCCGDIEDVASRFSNNSVKRNCYGGLSIQIKDWSFDIWQLDRTWAFQKNLVKYRGAWDFSKTTFLDIESIAVELFPKKGKKRRIFSKGFFESISSKTIEINLHENPNPLTCIIRALRIANTYRFAIGRDLANYISCNISKLDLEELFQAFRRRYENSTLSIEDLDVHIKAINEQLHESNTMPVKLPNLERNKINQAELFDSLENTCHSF